jgi:conjugal transfer/entry exclusion protein
MMADFKTAYNQFHEGSSNTREAIIDRSGHTQKLLDLFEEASDLKKNLNRLASQFKRKAPEFYQKYMAAANVIYKTSPKAVGADQVKPAANV